MCWCLEEYAWEKIVLTSRKIRLCRIFLYSLAFSKLCKLLISKGKAARLCTHDAHLCACMYRLSDLTFSPFYFSLLLATFYLLLSWKSLLRYNLHQIKLTNCNCTDWCNLANTNSHETPITFMIQNNFHRHQKSLLTFSVTMHYSV